MRFKPIYWIIPLLLICLGLLPKGLAIGGVNSTAMKNRVSDNIPAQSEHVDDVQIHLSKLSKRALFSSGLSDDIMTSPQLEIDEATLWTDFEYQLVGITKSGARHLALFIDPASGVKLNLSRGEAIESWTVNKILDGRVELTREGEKLWVELFKPEGEP